MKKQKLSTDKTANELSHAVMNWYTTLQLGSMTNISKLDMDMYLMKKIEARKAVGLPLLPRIAL
jgi:hypothetical protein